MIGDDLDLRIRGRGRKDTIAAARTDEEDDLVNF